MSPFGDPPRMLTLTHPPTPPLSGHTALPLMRMCRSKYDTDKIEELEFTVCVAPIATEVASEAEVRRAGGSGGGFGASTTPAGIEAGSSGSGRSGEAEAEAEAEVVVPPGQAFTAKTTLLLWLWLEQQCAG